MHRIFRVALLALAPLFTLLAQDALRTSTVTFSVGGEAAIHNYFGEGSAPAFTGNYEYRVLKYLAVEAGVETLLPQSTTYQVESVLAGQNLLSYFSTTCGNGCIFTSQTTRTRATLTPFGVKGILPLWSNRVELFAGVGGAYIFQSGASYGNAMLAQGNLGARIALDRGHRFWLGTSGHFLGNWGGDRQDWVTGSFDLGIRF